MIQDSDFYVTLPSNASSNLFLNNSKSSFRVALPRQIHLKDEEDWEVGLHHIVYPLSMFDITNDCKHSHIMLDRRGDSTPFVLPEGKYYTALDVTEGMLQCLNIADPPSKIEITVDDEWNVTLNSQTEGLLITLSTARALGWITENNTLTPSVRLNAALTLERKYGHDWFILPAGTSITYPGIYIFPPSLSLCSCKQRLVQVQTNLVEPWQVGDKRLPLLHEMIPLGEWIRSNAIIFRRYRQRRFTFPPSINMTNSFYMVLTSDASLTQYPENKAADFKMQLPSQLHLSEDWEVAMTRIIYPYTWQNVGENQLSYTLLCKTGPEPWKLNIPVPIGIYRTVKYVIHGMTKGLHNRLRDIYLKSDKTITSQGGNECFYIYEKAQDYFELKLPAGWYVILPKTLARALGYLNHQYNIPQMYQIGGLVQQNDDHSVLLARTTTTLVRKDELVWGLLSRDAFQTIYVYSDLIESQVVGDAQANLLRMLVPRGQPGNMITEEVKVPSYHRLRTTVFSSVAINIRGDTGQLIPFASGAVRVTLHFRRRDIL